MRMWLILPVWNHMGRGIINELCSRKANVSLRIQRKRCRPAIAVVGRKQDATVKPCADVATAHTINALLIRRAQRAAFAVYSKPSNRMEW